MADKKTENKDIESGWIRELAAILQETGLTEIEIEKGEVRLRVARAPAMTFAAAPATAPAAHHAAPATPGPMRGVPEPARRAGAVPSPMVGTAYLAPSPGAEPFIRKGDQVREGQTIMIIEAMKTMNPIAAPRAGAVVEIHVADGQPVEFGEILAVIE